MHSLIGISLTSAALIALLTGESYNRRKVVWIAKPLASSGFLIAALGFGALASLYGQLLLTALVLSFTGDILLIPKRKITFLYGLISFACAHIIFAAAFVVPGVNLTAAFAGAVFIAGVFLLIGKWLAPYLPSKMRTPVWIYFVVIGGMVSLAGGNTFNGGPPAIITGAVLFVVSDVAVARNRFVSPGFFNKIWGLPLYYTAQLLLASSIALV